MKDPYQENETPYEVLSIDSDASPREIHVALGEYLKSRNNPQIGMRSAALLRNTKDRLEFDLFSYSNLNENVDIEPTKLPELDRDIPIPEEGVIFTDLDLLDYFDDIPPVEFKRPDFIDMDIPLRSEEGWGSWEFDR